MPALHFERLMLPSGFARDVRLDVDAAGRIERLTTGVAPRDAEAQGATAFRGLALPGMTNLHSHAFQFALAGTAELPAPGQSDFWSWRTKMYDLALRIEPDDLETLAEALAIDLLLGGYTGLCEFHYVHHQPNGAPYPDPNELAHRVAAGAQRAGLPITLLPTLYQQGGFATAPSAEQRRFIRSNDRHLDAIAALAKHYEQNHDVAVGLSIHSLRAVANGGIREAVQAIGSIDQGAPIHIHIAEQVGEVEACLEHNGQRPIERLLGCVAVDWRYCLVHATHATADEIAQVGKSGAVVGICPTTEADLGDGIIDAKAYLDAGATIGIGSDQHVATSAAAELRALEYSQRLHRRRRAVLSTTGQSAGERLWRAAAKGGAQASDPTSRGTGGELAVGQYANLTVIDRHTARTAGLGDAEVLDALLFAPEATRVTDVIVRGRPVVQDARHPRQAEVHERLARTLTGLRTPRV